MPLLVFPAFWWRLLRVATGVALLAGAAWLSAADVQQPVVGIGATREEVLAAYGWPSGQSQLGDKEIFTYPQGQVVLQNGIVERMDVSAKLPWPKPKPRPPPPTTNTATPAAKASQPLPVIDPWVTDFEEARQEAKRLPGDILALFTGSDWSPPCKRFQAEVALNPEFLAAVRENFVLLKLDFPTHITQPEALRQQNAALRERFGVTTYPALLWLNAEGEVIARINLAKPRSEPTYAAQVVAAIEEAKPKPAIITVWKAPPSEKSTTPETILSDYSLYLLGGATVLLLACWWLVRRNAKRVATPASVSSTLMPTPADIATWPQERVRDVLSRLFEFEGWRVQARPTETGAELALSKGGHARPQVLVRCQAAAAGLAGGRAVKTLLGTTVAEGVEQAWYVSVGGFTPEARQFAGEHSIMLLSGEDLLQRLKSVPPLALIRLVAATG